MIIVRSVGGAGATGGASPPRTRAGSGPEDALLLGGTLAPGHEVGGLRPGRPAESAEVIAGRTRASTVRQFGLRPFDAGFYALDGEGLILERTDPLAGRERAFTLAQARGDEPVDW
ncbi:hypothetical protein [Cellulomonas pakistanensis]|uniref:Uncharacterized protein n=1 Tax=Cellulomonas pakistanensis TaxID=992287 RepID=A0A919U5Q0_9CELL|nr:hypothetical protein [Cellulomonas pakistanensis]GIG36264.1 hypothetical protein Cpa01nite_16450 [Cellulomonas pakistanensis]